MELAIITGTSKGLGEAVATLFIENGIHVIGIARNANVRLQQLAVQHDVSYTHLTCDLGEGEQLKQAVAAIREEVKHMDLNTIFLINNAAVVGPVNQAMYVEHERLSNHVHVNLVAPMSLTNACLELATTQGIPLYASIVTSGAAERPVYGWSAYCSTKAAVNMFVQTVGLEQAEQDSHHRVIAFNPGIMDTEMQVTIRDSSSEEFIDIEKFKNYKKQNLLQDPLTVADALFNVMKNRSMLENGKIYAAK
ncbi:MULTISPECIES: (S)-benzoin forming benzil reductase [unclassified Virgibacillus]|uniref:(S)-benzoin forming benzil reductase n=1 Tax=unclassified Virgibacillus TaxID=2620237 RepID=UPI0024DE47F8|nr:(S)-benzoin forming benzil reductase [Virgibacillus sp. LDC-1]